MPLPERLAPSVGEDVVAVWARVLEVGLEVLAVAEELLVLVLLVLLGFVLVASRPATGQRGGVVAAGGRGDAGSARRARGRRWHHARVVLVLFILPFIGERKCTRRDLDCAASSCERLLLVLVVLLVFLVRLVLLLVVVITRHLAASPAPCGSEKV